MRIQASPYLFKKTLCLGSMPHGPACHSPLSRRQEASMHSAASFNTVWVIDSPNPNDRLERQGEPVRAGEPLLIRHCQTQQYLASDKSSFRNDFGNEFEVMAHSFASANKTQNLFLEKQGAVTVDVPTRF